MSELDKLSFEQEIDLFERGPMPYGPLLREREAWITGVTNSVITAYRAAEIQNASLRQQLEEARGQLAEISGNNRACAVLKESTARLERMTDEEFWDRDKLVIERDQSQVALAERDTQLEEMRQKSDEWQTVAESGCFLADPEREEGEICPVMAERDQSQAALAHIRDAVLCERYQLAEAGCTSDQINAVLGIIDDACSSPPAEAVAKIQDITTFSRLKFAVEKAARFWLTPDEDIRIEILTEKGRKICSAFECALAEVEAIPPYTDRVDSPFAQDSQTIMAVVDAVGVLVEALKPRGLDTDPAYEFLIKAWNAYLKYCPEKEGGG